jgi:hypothetical protein
MSSLDGSEDDDKIYRDFDLPSYIVEEVADLSQYREGSPLQSFEEYLHESGHFCSETDEEIDQRMRWFTSIMTLYRSLEHPSDVECTSIASPFSCSNSVQEQWSNTGPSLDIEQAQNTDAGAGDLDRPIKEATSLQSSSAPRRTKRSTSKTGGLRVSDKKDLAPADIIVVGHRLINQELVLYFLTHC